MTSTTAPASFNAPFAPPRRLTGAGLIALGVGLNIPFAILGATFDYPDILRQPTAEVLQRFHAGGPPLIATWYAFLAAAIGFIPIAVLVHDSLAPGDGRRAPTALRLATVAGVGAGLVQALGLIRWVFAVPVLARTFNDPAATVAARASALVAFEGLHQYAGVALGEHLGQLGTAVWVLLISATLRSHAEFPRWQAWLGLASGLLILAGLVEGFATVISFNPGVLGLATPVGYVGFSVWMIAAGVSFLRRPSAAKRD